MKKKVLCTALAVTILLTQTASAAPWWLSKYRVTFDNELGIMGDVTLQFASDGGSFIRPITKRYGESISLENYVPTKYGYTFKGWFTDPRTKQNQVTIFKFTKTDVLYAKWEKNPEEPINPNDEIMAKDTCYLTDEETQIRNEIIKEKNKTYIEGFGCVAPCKTKTIIVDSDGDINKMVGTME
ncbi:MAG: InlB B-repeat-containing protein [Clostridia bacterium]|nr:InlB B-repeat-containing protein [Clostridia bacterium]